MQHYSGWLQITHDRASQVCIIIQSPTVPPPSGRSVQAWLVQGHYVRLHDQSWHCHTFVFPSPLSLSIGPRSELHHLLCATFQNVLLADATEQQQQRYLAEPLLYWPCDIAGERTNDYYTMSPGWAVMQKLEHQSFAISTGCYLAQMVHIIDYPVAVAGRMVLQNFCFRVSVASIP